MTIALQPTIYWTHLSHNHWKLHIAALSDGLCFVGSLDGPYDELAEWVGKRFPHHALVRSDDKLGPYAEELVEYLQGRRHAFTVPLHMEGTPFQADVWRALREIPYGQTVTYSQIAELVRRPDAVRAVGTAIGANPVLITVPCHRVIGKNGKLTGYRGGLEMKTKLLQLERESLPDE